MQTEIFLLWLIIWVILLAMSTIEVRGQVFGFLAGLWIIYLGIYVYLSGLQYQSGMTITTVGAVQTITNIYQDVVMPFSNYGMLWSIPFWGLGIYICFMAATKPKKNTG